MGLGRRWRNECACGASKWRPAWTDVWLLSYMRDQLAGCRGVLGLQFLRCVSHSEWYGTDYRSIIPTVCTLPSALSLIHLVCRAIKCPIRGTVKCRCAWRWVGYNLRFTEYDDLWTSSKCPLLGKCSQRHARGYVCDWLLCRTSEFVHPDRGAGQCCFAAVLVDVHWNTHCNPVEYGVRNEHCDKHSYVN